MKGRNSENKGKTKRRMRGRRRWTGEKEQSVMAIIPTPRTWSCWRGVESSTNSSEAKLLPACNPSAAGLGTQAGRRFIHRRMRVPLLFFRLWLWAAYSNWLSSETKENVNVVVELSVLISNGRGKQCFRKSTNIKKYLELKSFYFCYSFFFFFSLTYCSYILSIPPFLYLKIVISRTLSGFIFQLKLCLLIR